VPLTPEHRHLVKSALAGLVIGLIIPLIVRPGQGHHSLLAVVAMGAAAGLVIGLGSRLLGRLL